MANNKGKQFEACFKQNFLDSFPKNERSLDRLYDPQGGYVGIHNISDYIGYVYPNIFYLECKSHEGNTFPWSCLSQYDKLKEKVGIKGVRAGVVLWMIEHDKVIYLPISSITKMMEDGCKSFNIKMLKDDKYKIYEIPSTKKRVFMESDYKILTTLQEGE